MLMSETFWVGLYTSLIGFSLALGNQCYKSKCKEVSFCCLKITRDTSIEEELDNQQPRNPIQSQGGL